VEATNEAFDKVLPHEDTEPHEEPTEPVEEYFVPTSYHSKSPSFARSPSTRIKDNMFERTLSQMKRDAENREAEDVEASKAPKEDEGSARLTEEEQRESGGVSWADILHTSLWRSLAHCPPHHSDSMAGTTNWG
jgi:hypothetical protein